VLIHLLYAVEVAGRLSLGLKGIVKSGSIPSAHGQDTLTAGKWNETVQALHHLEEVGVEGCMMGGRTKMSEWKERSRALLTLVVDVGPAWSVSILYPLAQATHPLTVALIPYGVARLKPCNGLWWLSNAQCTMTLRAGPGWWMSDVVVTGLLLRLRLWLHLLSVAIALIVLLLRLLHLRLLLLILLLILLLRRQVMGDSWSSKDVLEHLVARVGPARRDLLPLRLRGPRARASRRHPVGRTVDGKRSIRWARLPSQ
jgi:hypothetical protein